MRKKRTSLLLAAVMITAVFTGCSGGDNGGKDDGEQGAASFDTSRNITVISREEGSGTRGAFIELFGVEEKDADGNKKDKTTKDATIATQTEAVLTQVAGDPYAIGYVSLGSLNETVKALKIDGAEATPENISSGAYQIARPFNIATKGDATGLTKDFIDFILSKEGQDVVAKDYIKVNDNAPAYAGTKPSGKLVVAGSSSVSPIMQKLKEAYIAINPDAEIEIQTNDSTTGMTMAMDGTCDIGMASRELKDAEKEALQNTVIATDGIAVVVNKENSLEDLTSAQVKDIYTGVTTAWSEVQ